MATTVSFSVRIDRDIKKQCEDLYNELGMNLTTAINIFLRQSLRVGGIPFDVRIGQPNKKTIAALLEAMEKTSSITGKYFLKKDRGLSFTRKRIRK